MKEANADEIVKNACNLSQGDQESQDCKKNKSESDFDKITSQFKRSWLERLACNMQTIHSNNYQDNNPLAPLQNLYKTKIPIKEPALALILSF